MALEHIKRVDPHLHAATLPYHGLIVAEVRPKRTRDQLFESLIRTVIAQQLGLPAARSIFNRVQEACNGHITSLSVLKMRTQKLRAMGLSGAKIKTFKAIAKAVADGTLNLLSLKKMPEHEVSAKLMSIHGLGPWSVDMFMIFALGRSDVFSPGDLGLVRAIETIYGLPKGAGRDTVLKISEKWSPHRTYVSLLLWKSRDPK